MVNNLDCDPVLQGLLPFGNGCDAVPKLKAAVEAIANSVCATCANSISNVIPAVTSQSDYLAVGWGGIAPDGCDILWAMIDDGRIFASFDSGVTWSQFNLDPSSVASKDIQEGFGLTTLGVNALNVDMGSAMIGGVMANTNESVVLVPSAAADWIDGVSHETASQILNVYVNTLGSVKLWHEQPLYPLADTNSMVATMRVNDGTWNGTAGNGLNATTIPYDNDAGEANIQPGMLLCAYTDANYTQGRGRTSAAAGSTNDASRMRIISVNTSTNEITVAGDHNIALHDNDYLCVIEGGAVLFREISGTWWRWVGSVWNDASGDLSSNYHDEGFILHNSSPSTNSTVYIDLDPTNGVFRLVTQGGSVDCRLLCSKPNASWGGIGVTLDEIYPLGTSTSMARTDDTGQITLFHRFQDIPPGTHIARAKLIKDANATTAIGPYWRFDVREV